MKVNRMRWIKKILKLTHRLTKFSNAIALEKRIIIERFVDIIQFFKEELRDWQIELEWIDSFDKGNTTMDLRSYKYWVYSGIRTTGTTEFIWWHEGDKKDSEVLQKNDQKFRIPKKNDQKSLVSPDYACGEPKDHKKDDKKEL